ncbi:MAG TPA: uroporphyrinogen-III synthase [Bryobacteraceae bacterium]|nr:uroporphyrinogen-III synthase [Bryobacteraceae bacterium]
MSFAGKRVLSLESRRAAETAELIRRNGGIPAVAPSMREVPLDANPQVLEFADRLERGDFDAVIFTTGIGARHLAEIIELRHAPEWLPEQLRKVAVIVRGPKPSAVMREWKVPVAANAPEPNTWRELVGILEDRTERRIAVQLFGRPQPELTQSLQALGAEVTEVPVYAYQLPEDLGPLREAASDLARRRFEVSLFTTGQQVVHLLQIAREMGLDQPVRDGLARTVIASIGPTTTETLREYGLAPDLEPSHPKLGMLVKETAERASELLERKRA